MLAAAPRKGQQHRRQDGGQAKQCWPGVTPSQAEPTRPLPRCHSCLCVWVSRRAERGHKPPLDGPGPGPGLDAAQPWWSGASAPSWRAPMKCTHGRAPPPSVRSPPARPRGGPAETRSPHTGRARHHSADQPWGFPRRYFPRTVPGWTVAHHRPRREVARVQLRPPTRQVDRVSEFPSTIVKPHLRTSGTYLFTCCPSAWTARFVLILADTNAFLTQY